MEKDMNRSELLTITLEFLDDYKDLGDEELTILMKKTLSEMNNVSEDDKKFVLDTLNSKMLEIRNSDDYKRYKIMEERKLKNEMKNFYSDVLKNSKKLSDSKLKETLISAVAQMSEIPLDEKENTVNIMYEQIKKNL